MKPLVVELSRRDRVAVVGGSIVAAMMVAASSYSLISERDIGIQPGLICLGLAGIVAAAGIVFDRRRTHPSLDWVVNGLLAASAVLFFGAFFLY